MFTHSTEIQPKPASFIEPSQKIQDQIMPALRLQKELFCDVTSIETIWSTASKKTYRETEEALETRQRTGYRWTLKMLSGLIGSVAVRSISEVPVAQFKPKHKPAEHFFV
jgi:hypothetical protein